MRRLLPLLAVCSFAVTVTAQKVDLRLTSVSLPSVAAPGVWVNVYAYYTSNSVDPAKDFTLTMSVPPGTTYGAYVVNPVGNPLTCTGPPKGEVGDLVCSSSSLPARAGNLTSVGLSVFVDPTAVPGTVITFPVTLTSTNAINPSQALSGSLTVVEPADLKVEISAPASVAPGDTFLSTITVTNRGPGPAYNAFVSYDVLPISSGALTPAPGWSCPHSVNCTIDSFPPGTATFIGSATVAQYQPGLTSLTASAHTSSPNNTSFKETEATATTAVVVPPPTTLAVTLTAPSAVQFADEVPYTAQITNTGNVDAKLVVLAWSLHGTLVAMDCGNSFYPRCSLPSLAAGATQTVTATVLADASGPLLPASATATALNDPASHTATVSTTITPPPKVDVQAGVSGPASIPAGGEGLWRFSITNNGPETVRAWSLRFDIPQGATFSRSGDGSSKMSAPCALLGANELVQCQSTSLAPGASFERSLYLTVAPSATGTIEAVARVSSEWDTDQNSSNDTAKANTQLLPPQPPARRRAARH